jgi:hypothetical protein
MISRKINMAQMIATIRTITGDPYGAIVTKISQIVFRGYHNSLI